MGGYPSKAIDWASSHDLCFEEAYPYVGVQRHCNASTCTAPTNAIPHSKIQGYRDVTHASSSALQAAISSQPISICIEAMDTLFRHYQGGVLTNCSYRDTDHCILAIGYGTDAELGDYWLVKNSWGTSWGEAGYARLGRGTSASQYGECGILSYPRFPVVDGAPPGPPTPPPPPPPPPTPPPPPSPSPFACASGWPLAKYSSEWSTYCHGGGWKAWAMATDCSVVGHVEGHAGSQKDATSAALYQCTTGGAACAVFDEDGTKC